MGEDSVILSAAIAHLVATITMFGIVLFVQVVQYPLLAHGKPEDRPEFERAYTRRAGLVIAPTMCIEAAGAAFLLLTGPLAGSFLALVGAGLLALIWLTTFLVSVPCHERLSHQWDDGTHRRLLWSNVVRLIAWSGRVGVAVGVLRGVDFGV